MTYIEHWSNRTCAFCARVFESISAWSTMWYKCPVSHVWVMCLLLLCVANIKRQMKCWVSGFNFSNFIECSADTFNCTSLADTGVSRLKSLNLSKTALFFAQLQESLDILQAASTQKYLKLFYMSTWITDHTLKSHKRNSCISRMFWTWHKP